MLSKSLDCCFHNIKYFEAGLYITACTLLRLEQDEGGYAFHRVDELC